MTPPEKKLSLLIVEDNPGDFLLIEDYLREEIKDPEIRHASTFSKAKEYLIKNNHYDAILLDLSLPDSNGETLVSEMMELAGLTPVIVLTGYSDKEFGIKTLSVGISDYLFKDDLTSSQLFKSISYSIERKRITFQIKESESKYRNLFNLSPLPMWVMDVSSFGFLNVNEAAIAHYQYSREEFMTMTIKDIMPLEEIKFLEELENIKKPWAFKQGKLRHKKKNGELIHVDLQSNIIDFNGRKARLVLAIDISERIKYIQAIENQNKKMREIEWMQSHVVRAPLARIMGLINLLSDGPVEEISLKKILDNILSSGNELDKIIREIVKKTEQIND